MKIKYTNNLGYHPKGAGISLFDGWLLYSTSFPLVNTIYVIYVNLILIYSIALTPIQTQIQKIKIAKYMWIATGIFHLMYLLQTTPWISYHLLGPILNIFAVTLIILMIIFIPEGFILSKSQIMSTYYLYDKIALLSKEPQNKLTGQFAYEKLIDYLDSIPIEVKEKLQNKVN